jgi:hypothetical protein
MNQFLNTLTVSPYPDGVTWYLDGPLSYSGSAGIVIVPDGFETDFASVPAIVTNIFPRWGDYGLASIVHDWLYWNQAQSRQVADNTFLEAMTALNVSAWKRQTLYRSVRMFGQSAWDDNARIGADGFSRVRTPGTAQKLWSRQG